MGRKIMDQMGREITVSENPQRIISLVPSQTELLWDLGLQEEVVGITKFCIHPDEWFRSKVRVGGTKKLNIERIKSLEPDLIIGNKEENTKEDIEALEKISSVWMSDIHSFEAAMDMIQAIGILSKREERAKEIIREIVQKFAHYPLVDNGQKVLYFIWKDPFFVAGKNTFIDEMIRLIGWQNACDEDRYPEWEEDKWSTDIVLLSSEPYPFNAKDLQEFQCKYPTAKVVVVDGEMFSWYGSRLLKAPAYFQQLVHQLANKSKAHQLG